ncbi:MAG TPA: hypothetical protein VGQ48_04675 [Gemmatimonadales bacterium]|nr:hypothetical protein [Gemmatimonadales bacterium]
MTRRWAWLFLLGAAACTEQATSPGVCPNFCPGGSIQVHDTIFTAIIERDSSFRGYAARSQGEGLAAADLPVVQSRPFFVLSTMITRLAPKSGDTTTVPISVDSARLRLSIVRRAKEATNLTLRLYLLPLTADSTSDFASLDPFFSAAAVDSVNVSDLLARPAIGDTATVRIWGDSIRTDSAGHILQIARSDSTLVVYFSLDTTQAPFSVPDSGRVAFGVRVTADSLASIRLGANESVTNGPVMRWFYHYTDRDSAMTVKADSALRAPRFDSFVFDPPNPPLDDTTLVVGGAPSARSLLRVAMPAFLHDSFDVVRATVILVPVAAVQAAPSDSFTILVRPVLTDLGAKSPLSPATEAFGRVVVHPGSSDTLRFELTDMVRSWAIDTTFATAFFLGQIPEAASFTEIRFYSSRVSAFRPALHVTYVKRFPFGEP